MIIDSLLSIWWHRLPHIWWLSQSDTRVLWEVRQGHPRSPRCRVEGRWCICSDPEPDFNELVQAQIRDVSQGIRRKNWTKWEMKQPNYNWNSSNTLYKVKSHMHILFIIDFRKTDYILVFAVLISHFHWPRTNSTMTKLTSNWCYICCH